MINKTVVVRDLIKFWICATLSPASSYRSVSSLEELSRNHAFFLQLTVIELAEELLLEVCVLIREGLVD